MGKKKKERTNKKFAAKVNLQELQESRNGGQAALRGYSYQFLYSCNLILSSDADTVFILEGIEDVDSIKCSDGGKTITHIQVKYSTQHQDASFMDSVLKNYLEAYLIDRNRYFKLVYDFSVTSGNLRKLFLGNLDKNSKEIPQELNKAKDEFDALSKNEQDKLLLFAKCRRDIRQLVSDVERLNSAFRKAWDRIIKKKA